MSLALQHNGMGRMGAVIAVTLAAVVATGCVTQGKYDDLAAERDKLSAELAESNEASAKLKMRLDTANSEAARMGEKLVETSDLLKGGSVHTLKLHRAMVDGVIETPGGAHFTECPPDYGRDESFQKEYAATAKDEGAWEEFKIRYLDVPEAEYQAAVQARSARSEPKASGDQKGPERSAS